MSSRWAFAAVALAACGGKATPASRSPVTAMPVPQIKVGECAVPERDGVMTATPDRVRDRRDLDGDGVDETLIADRALCQGENCYWNVFSRHGDDPCERFAGTVAGARLEAQPTGGSGGNAWADLRGYWLLGGDRLLIQTYQFHRGGYLLVDALVCRRVADDRVVCAETDERGADPS